MMLIASTEMVDKSKQYENGGVNSCFVVSMYEGKIPIPDCVW